MTTTTLTPDEMIRLATDLFDLVGARDVDGITALLHDDFVSHNPNVAHDAARESARDAFIQFLRGSGGERLMSAQVTLRRIGAHDDLVWLHNRLDYPGAEIAAVDILRVQDGRFVKHWDVVQPIPDPLPHPHGMV